MGSAYRNIRFELDQHQSARFRKWRDGHLERHSEQIQHELTSAAFEFRFLPCGLGNNEAARCIWCGEAISLSVGDDGEFIYNEDGTPNGWTGEVFKLR